MACKKMVSDHKITGKHAHLLTDEDLRDVGMIVVGDRLAEIQTVDDDHGTQGPIFEYDQGHVEWRGTKILW